MTPDEFKMLAGLGCVAWSLSAIAVLIVQTIAWPDDRQKWAAAAAIISVLVTFGRLSLSYLFGIALGTNEQGVVLFVLGAMCWLWFAAESYLVNRGLFRPRLQRWRYIVRSWIGM